MASTENSGKNLIKTTFVLIFAVVLAIFSVPVNFYRTSNVVKAEDENLLKIHYINVGQGDSIFIELPDSNKMLIDAGPKSSSEKVVSYIKNLGITKINYLILTHSDEDHVGGMVSVFENFEVENIYRPFILATRYESIDELIIYEEGIYPCNTEIYSKFIKAAYEETFDGYLSNIFINYDGVFIPSEDATHSFSIEFHTPPVASSEKTENFGLRAHGYPTKLYSGTKAHILNAVSPIISLQYGEKKYLFTGDSNDLNEPDFIANLPTSGPGSDSADAARNADILKVAHHGAESSTCKEFLDIVNPAYAVISAGANNKYGHPHEALLTRLTALWPDDSEYRILRTDLNGDIVATCTENSITFGLTIDGESVSFNAMDGYIPVNKQKSTIPSWVKYVAIGAAVLIVVIGIIIKIKLDHKEERLHDGNRAKRRRRRR